MRTESDLADDLLEGVPEISGYTGFTEPKTRSLLARGLLPGWKLGAIWHARKSELKSALTAEQMKSRI